MCQHVSLVSPPLPPKRLAFTFFLLFTKCWNIIFPRTEWEPGKRKWLFLFITFHFGQPDGAFFFSFFAEQTIKYMLQFTFKCFKNIRETLEQDYGFNSLLSELLSFSSFHHRVSIHERFTAEQWQESRNKIRTKTVSSQ